MSDDILNNGSIKKFIGEKYKGSQKRYSILTSINGSGHTDLTSINQNISTGTTKLSMQELEEVISNMDETELSYAVMQMIPKINGDTFEVLNTYVYLHLILHQLGVYEADKRQLIVSKMRCMFPSRDGQFAKEKRVLIDKMRELVLEYDNLLRAESIMIQLEGEAKNDADNR